MNMFCQYQETPLSANPPLRTLYIVWSLMRRRVTLSKIAKHYKTVSVWLRLFFLIYLCSVLYVSMADIGYTILIYMMHKYWLKSTLFVKDTACSHLKILRQTRGSWWPFIAHLVVYWMNYQISIKFTWAIFETGEIQ